MRNNKDFSWGVCAGIGMGVNICFIAFIPEDPKLRLARLTSKYHFYTLLVLSVIFLLTYTLKLYSHALPKQIINELTISAVLAAVFILLRMRYLARDWKLIGIYFMYFGSFFLYCSGFFNISNDLFVIFLLLPLSAQYLLYRMEKKAVKKVSRRL